MSHGEFTTWERDRGAETGIQRFPNRSPSGCSSVEAGRPETADAAVAELWVTAIEAAGVEATGSGAADVAGTGFLPG